jgi:hypothetical protein
MTVSTEARLCRKSFGARRETRTRLQPREPSQLEFRIEGVCFSSSALAGNVNLIRTFDCFLRFSIIAK